MNTPAMSVEDRNKQKKAEENALASNEAHRLAAEARAREGNMPPLVNALASSILDKLKNLPPEKKEGETQMQP